MSNVHTLEKSVIFPDSTTAIGNRAEVQAVLFLENKGYEIISRNWKTKWCEIDIVAKSNGRIHFVEVKYRRNANQGGGIAAITPTKLRQMKFAAELWLQKYGTHDALLSAIEVTGEGYEITRYEDRV